MFECAKFARDSVRKTSRALGQITDASSRYAKGVDEYSTVMGIKRALHLIEELGCGKVSRTHCDVNTGNSVEPREMKVSIAKVNGVLGIEVPTEEIIRILTNLQFAPVVNGDELTLQIPAYREDMESYPDVAEEVIRMYGYDHVIPTFMPTAKVTTGGINTKQKGELRLKRALCGTGAHECIHYSFFAPSDLDLLGFAADAPERQAIPLMNPINEGLSIMRTTLAASMVHAIARNQKRGNLEGRLFEIANIFMPKALPLTEYPDEQSILCVGVFGEKESFFTLKGMAETVADTLNVTFTYERAQKPFLHPYQTAAIYCDGEEVGYLGKMSYELQDALDMRVAGYVMEINLEKLAGAYENVPKFTPLPKFAEEKRDLALIMNKEMTNGEVEECIKGACAYITEVTLFDVYEGASIPEGKKSMAYTIRFTPKDEEFGADTVDKFVEKILKTLKKNLEIELRA